MSDVLMVWHSHMLNPRKYLEDCIRHGKMHVWGADFPWELVDRHIDGDKFEYVPSEETPKSFEAQLGINWDNLLAPSTTTVECPKCSSMVIVDWTKGQVGPCTNHLFSAFTGFADKDFRATCHECQFSIDHDRLKVAKWRQDVRLLLEQDTPMPGCFYNIRGVPFPAPKSWKKASFLYPSQLVHVIGDDMLEFTDPKADKCHHISDLRKYLEEKMKERKALQMAHDTHLFTSQPIYAEKLCIRRMMSRYWDNSGPFALNLSSAVIRQGKFVQQMERIDWIRSPTLQATIDRLIAKYEIFFKIMAGHPRHMAVPTLDVDLAWHTHLLSPARYYNYSVGSTIRPVRFIDHNDKVDELKLSDGFEWTCKIYREVTNGSIYSECVCWYCEAIRYPDLYGRFRTSAAISNARRAADELRIQPNIASEPNFWASHFCS